MWPLQLDELIGALGTNMMNTEWSYDNLQVHILLATLLK